MRDNSTENRTVPAAAIAALGLACLVAAYAFQPGLVRMRERIVGGSTSKITHDSPIVVFSTVALGGFRGILMDMLWNRVSELQMEQGDYIEMVQLSDWITKLEPRLPVIWDFHSFNMAFNITAMCSDPAERWRWVSNGIRLLRDEAIVRNPGEGSLYDRLCRIYRYKLLERKDPARDYYRLALAAEMEAALAGLMDGTGGTIRSVDKTRQFMKTTGLDPAAMQAIDAELGPFDWRLPEAHVIYWARKGKEGAPGVNDRGFDGIAADAIADTFLAGSILEFKPSEGILRTGPRYDYLARALSVFDELLIKYPPQAKKTDIDNSYGFFLRRAIPLLTVNGRREEAGRLLATLQEKLAVKESLGLTLDQYVEFVTKTPPPPDPRDEIKRKAIEEHGHHDH